MSLKEQITADLKAAMLSKDKELTLVLQSLKSAILYKEVADGKRDEGLDDASIVTVLKKERKSRQDSYDMYTQAHEQERADIENYQIGVIDGYLPEQMSEDDAKQYIKKILADKGIDTVEMKHMGIVMGEVKSSGMEIDGGVVSKIMKEMM